jgi:hypothetical protein
MNKPDGNRERLGTWGVEFKKFDVAVVPAASSRRVTALRIPLPPFEERLRRTVVESVGNVVRSVFKSESENVVHVGTSVKTVPGSVRFTKGTSSMSAPKQRSL